MTAQTKSYWKALFITGYIPTQSNYSDLVDSYFDTLALPLVPAQGGLGTTTAPGVGYVPIGNSSGGFTLAPISAGANVTITNNSGSITISSSGTGTVTSVSATVPSFLTVAGSPITVAGTLAISLSGTALPVANGGTGVTTTPTSGNILIGNASSGYTLTGLTAGSGIAITPGSGSITIAATNAGTVTSAGLTVPPFLQVTGTPITSSGTFAIGYGTSALPATVGGTGITATVSNGQLLIGNGAAYTLSTLTAGTGVSIANASGSITISASGFPVSDATYQVYGSVDASKTQLWNVGGNTTGKSLTIHTQQTTSQNLYLPNITSSDTVATWEFANVFSAIQTSLSAGGPVFRAQSQTSSYTSIQFYPNNAGALELQSTATHPLGVYDIVNNVYPISYQAGTSVTGILIIGCPLTTVASTTANAGLVITPGAAPTGTPANGSMWVTGAGAYIQVGGSTVGPLASSSGGSSFPASDTTYSVQNASDPTKVQKWDLSALATHQTFTFQVAGFPTGPGAYTVIIPTSNNNGLAYDTLAGLGADQIFSGTNVFNGGFNIAQGTATPAVNGDVDITTAGFFTKFNGVVQNLAPWTTLGDTNYGGTSGTNTRLAGNTTTTKKFLSQTGTGSVSAATVWSTIALGDVPNLPGSIITSSVVGTSYGGTGLNASAAANGQILIGTGSGLALAAPTGTSPVTVTAGSGTLAIGLGTVGVGNGGTGLTGTPSNGQLPIGNGANYTLSTITAGTGVTVTNGSGTITIAATGTSGVSTLNTLSGALTIVAGSNVTVTPSGSNITISATSGGASLGNYTGVADTAHTMISTDTVVAYTSLTATRAVTLPAASAATVGLTYTVKDLSGSPTQAINITIGRAGSDTIEGGTIGWSIRDPRGFRSFISDGVSNWTLVGMSRDTQFWIGSGSYTWHAEPGAKWAHVELVGGGAGGGGGPQQPTTNAAVGGGGGSSGGYSQGDVLVSDIGTTAAVVIGVGGTGGIGSAATTTAGANGTAGTTSNFAAGVAGAQLSVTGAALSSGGGNATGGVSGSPGQGLSAGFNGGTGNTSGGSGNPGNSTYNFAPGAGGAGGGIAVGAAAFNYGGNGGSGSVRTSNFGASGSQGNAYVNTDGATGNSPPNITPSGYCIGAPGAAGGSSSIITTGGLGGTGARPGGGGGGGGASNNGYKGGNGGPGGDGAAFVTQGL